MSEFTYATAWCVRLQRRKPHHARAVGDAEAELLHREALAGVPIPGVQHHVRQLDRPVAVGGFSCRFRIGDEAVALAFGPSTIVPDPPPGASKLSIFCRRSLKFPKRFRERDASTAAVAPR
jgi:hypothetical protein